MEDIIVQVTGQMIMGLSAAFLGAGKIPSWLFMILWVVGTAVYRIGIH